MNLSSSMALMPAEWKHQNTVPPLGEATHVWAIELYQHPPYLNQQYQWLSDGEKNKAQRMRVDRKRDYQIQSRAWLRWLLASYLGIVPEHINYKYGPLGKPYLDADHNQIYFNATDSGNTLLCAFSAIHEIGLDIESTPRKVNSTSIAEKKFTQQEQDAISSLQPANRDNAFLAIWTRKEAFGKAIGVGIRYPMNEYHLCNDFKSYRHSITDQNAHDWLLFQFNYKNNIACLASRQKHEKIYFYKLDIDSVGLA